jgi:hypothetical protein
MSKRYSNQLSYAPVSVSVPKSAATGEGLSLSVFQVTGTAVPYISYQDPTASDAYASAVAHFDSDHARIRRVWPTRAFAIDAASYPDIPETGQPAHPSADPRPANRDTRASGDGHLASHGRADTHAHA